MSKESGKPRIVLILGSAPDVLRAREFPRGHFSSILAINNAWAVREDWDYFIHPDDFPADRRPPLRDPNRQTIITSDNYVPVQNRFGGFVYAGGTMAFTAGYWALGELRPDILAFLGCDMNYDARNGRTHFYGRGAADPLRADISLQSLEAKSARLMLIAALENCRCINLSAQKSSRLVFPRASLASLAAEDMRAHLAALQAELGFYDFEAISAARQRESDLGYAVPSGRYWEEQHRFDAAALRDIDDMWLDAAGLGPPAKCTRWG